jgi:hypothetical protein
MSQLKLPKTRLAIVLGLPGRSLCAEVFLADYAQGHAGPERVSDLLGGRDEFFPAQEIDGPVRLVSRSALLWARIPAQAWDGHPVAGTVDEPVQVWLDDGSHLEGRVKGDAPQERSRLVDWLNDAPEFLALYEEGSVVLVNRRRVVAVTRVPQPGERA